MAGRSRRRRVTPAAVKYPYLTMVLDRDDRAALARVQEMVYEKLLPQMERHKECGDGCPIADPRMVERLHEMAEVAEVLETGRNEDDGEQPPTIMAVVVGRRGRRYDPDVTRFVNVKHRVKPMGERFDA
jgi:hypothetical protein